MNAEMDPLKSSSKLLLLFELTPGTTFINGYSALNFLAMSCFKKPALTLAYFGNMFTRSFIQALPITVSPLTTTTGFLMPNFYIFNKDIQ